MSYVGLRAVVGARVSVLKDEGKVSHLAQQRTGSSWVETQGASIVGAFEDLDVSASISPFDRPDLGRWFKEQFADSFDILVFSKIDRAFRSTRHMIKVAEWCEEHKKILVFAEDGLVLNYLNPAPGLEGMLAELFVYIGSFFAQLELNRFSTRTKDGHRIIRQTDRWAYGIPRFGFKTAPHPSGKGRCIVQDPAAQHVLHEQIKPRVFAGDSLTSIVAHLNKCPHELRNEECPGPCQGSAVPTSLERSRVESGKPRLRREPWTHSALLGILTSHGTQGIKVASDGYPVLTADGSMIQMVDPSFTAEEWERIQAEVAKRRLSGKKRVNSENPILGVGFCGKCKRALSQHIPAKEIRHTGYFRCANKPDQGCKVLVRTDVVLPFLEETFLGHYGPRPVIRRVLVPGSDNRAELERVKDSIQRVRDESDAGLIVTPEERAQYIGRLKGLTARKTVLEASPVTAPRYEVETTGETFAEAWKRLDAIGRRDMMREAGIRLEVHSKMHLHLFDTGDTAEGYQEWMSRVKAGHVDSSSWDGENYTRSEATGWTFWTDDDGTEHWHRVAGGGEEWVNGERSN
ncbi:recombinase family protein [Nocardia sp. R6R-6]|uniref:recombinase family protein n=1 Tax=Nocardia sp. R6R-6 TaxID=3459303 RepID=UPI00403D7F39